MDEGHWHSAHGDVTSDCKRNKRIAESMRYVICESENNSQCSRGAETPAFRTMISDYSKLMQSHNISNINNYASSILPLIANKRNESDQWVSTLDFKSFLEGSGLLSMEGLPSANIKMPEAGSSEKVTENSVGSSESVKEIACDPQKPILQNSRTLFGNAQKPIKGPNNADDEFPNDLTVDSFRTAKEQLIINNAKQNKQQFNASSYGLNKKSLGARRGGGKFVPPIPHEENSDSGLVQTVTRKMFGGQSNKSNSTHEPSTALPDELSHLDEKIVELIMSEILDSSSPISWSDIAGLDFAKKTIKEIVVLPMLRPDIFTGLRGPPKGLLLFGPPGTGKTLIGKCVASQSKSTFFSISASSLTSKWVGEGEKLVRTLFAVARYKQPSIVFIDEIDSLLTQRSESEHESSRRIKTEFLVQMDGVGCNTDDRVLVIGATNRPQELDEAARRRFVKRLYIPLPDPCARLSIIRNLMATQKSCLSEKDHSEIIKLTEGYSGADMANLCKEAAIGPIRDIPLEDIESVSLDHVRPISRADFDSALKQVKASVCSKDLNLYLTWNSQFGSWDIPNL